MIPSINAASCQEVSISGVSAQSAQLPTDQSYIWSTVDCFVSTGSNPTATASGAGNLSLLAYTPWPIRHGMGDKIAVIGSTGKLYIAPFIPVATN